MDVKSDDFITKRHQPGPTQMNPTQSRNARSGAGARTPKMRAASVNFFYGAFQALHDVSLEFASEQVTALIGPSGCGKSTFLRNLNRINETLRDTRIEGEITLDGENILDMDVTEIRRRVGMVFQRPNPFPKSIFENIIYGPQDQRHAKQSSCRGVVEKSLRRAALWDEVKDKLNESAYALSGGQQQRFASRRAWRSIPKFCCSTSPVRRSTRLPRPRLKIFSSI